MTIVDDAKAVQDDLVRLRRDLHRAPEVGLDLPRTQERVLEALQGLPLEVSTGQGLSSVTAILRGQAAPDGERPTVLLRGDMDALPVTERTGLDFTAAGETMHACGHDLHTAMLVGAARVLAGQRDKLTGEVVFMSQPGEEATTAHDTWSRRACWTRPGSESTPRSRCTSRPACCRPASSPPGRVR